MVILLFLRTVGRIDALRLHTYSFVLTIPELASVDKLDGLFEGFHRNTAQHRTKHFFVIAGDAGPDTPSEYCGSQEVSLLVSRDGKAPIISIITTIRGK